MSKLSYRVNLTLSRLLYRSKFTYNDPGVPFKLTQIPKSVVSEPQNFRMSNEMRLQSIATHRAWGGKRQHVQQLGWITLINASHRYHGLRSATSLQHCPAVSFRPFDSQRFYGWVCIWNPDENTLCFHETFTTILPHHFPGLWALEILIKFWLESTHFGT